VVEEGYPFIERYVSALGLMRERRILGKLTGALPRMGELGPDAIKRCFGLPVAPALQLPGLADVLVGARRGCATSARTPTPTSPSRR
jgi:TPP-dependent indolepyruvate ferredoxin oxidoreductase alpha subunit